MNAEGFHSKTARVDPFVEMETLRLIRGAMLGVRILLPGGMPAQGIHVGIWHPDTIAEHEGGLTSENGEVRFAVDPGKRYQFSVGCPPDKAVSLAAPVELEPGESIHEIQLVNMRKAALAFQFSDGTRPALAFLRLTSIHAASRTSLEFWRPDVSSLELPDEPFVMSVCAPGARILTRSFARAEWGQPDGLILTLDPGSHVLGALVDSENRALSGVQLEARAVGVEGWTSSTGFLDALTVRTFSDAEGRFRLGPLTPGRYRIRVIKGGTFREIAFLEAYKDHEDLGLVRLP